MNGTNWARKARALRVRAFFTFLIESLLRTLTKTNAPYLRRRKRTKWWKREAFPRVPADKVERKKLANVLSVDVDQINTKFDEYFNLFKKMVPLGCLFFFASFNLTILQNTKDALVVISGGAEQLPFLAAYCVLPLSLAFFIYYNKLIETVHPQRVFYFALAPLLGFYALFGAVLYPNAQAIHLSGMRDTLMGLLPVGFHGLVGIVCNWTYSLFFCFAELWGTVVISVLFWTIANDLCSVKEAKTVYPLLGISANIALVVGGNFLKMVNNRFASGSFSASLQVLIGSVLFVSLLMMWMKSIVDRINDQQKLPAQGGPQASTAKADATASAVKPKKGKKKMTFAESWTMIAASKKVQCLAMLVVGYAVSHRLFEVSWKGQLKSLYPTAQAYQSVLADVSIATGMLTIALMVMGRFVFQYFGWRVAAMTTPTLMLATGSGFFAFSLASKYFSIADPITVATFAATMGALTQIVARSSKFALFDPAKEMVYIEMDEAERKKGKAAVDLVGSQFGKTGASWITQGTLLLTGSVQDAMAILGSVFGVVVVFWIAAVNMLHRMMQEYEIQAKAKKESAPSDGQGQKGRRGAKLIENSSSRNGNGTASEQLLSNEKPQSSAENMGEQRQAKME